MEARDRLSYWVEAVCNTYVQLDCDATAAAAPIDGTSKPTAGHARPVPRDATPQSCGGRRAKIARATEDYFLVSIQTKGHGKIVQDGRVARCRLATSRFTT